MTLQTNSFVHSLSFYTRRPSLSEDACRDEAQNQARAAHRCTLTGRIAQKEISSYWKDCKWLQNPPFCKRAHLTLEILHI